MLPFMRMEWLFGRENVSGANGVVPGRSLDIDIVEDLHRELKQRHEQMVAAALALPESREDYDVEANMNLRRERQRAVDDALSTTPRIYLSPVPPRGAPPFSGPTTNVTLAEVPGLNAQHRASLMMEGAGVEVSLRRGTTAHLSLDLRRPDNQDLLPILARILAGGGRRRAQWSRLLRFVPYAFAAVVTGIGVWMLASDRPGLPTALFTAAVLTALWVGAVVCYQFLARRHAGDHPGHRFREVSRLALRDRLTNARANFLVSLYTVPAGAILGYLLRLWFGG